MHAVLLRGKRPIYRGWNKCRPSLDSVVHHVNGGQDIGLKPASIGTSALDVDDGDVFELIDATDPLVTLPTRRGHHCYYEDDRGRGNGQFKNFHGCSGDVRSDKGYLKILKPHVNIILLADAVANADGNCPFPEDLFDAVGLPLKRVPMPLKGGGAALMTTPAKPSWVLEEVQVGNRHNALFDSVRFWAYAQERGTDLPAWVDRVHRHAVRCNDQLPDPMPHDELYRTISYSIAQWVWVSLSLRGHSIQRKRGGIKRYYGNASPKTIKRVNERHEEVINLNAMGTYKQREIANAVGLDQSRVSRITAEINALANRNRDQAMAELRDAGRSWRSIARLFNVDHKTVKARVGKLKVGNLC